MKKPFGAYQGDEAYVFVCYAHADSEFVYPEIAWLHEQGINIWYDEGISAGRNWRAEIGKRLLAASRILFYISSNSMESVHCSREINLAFDESKDIIPVYVENVELTPDLMVGLARVQALFRATGSDYRPRLLGAMTGSLGSEAASPNATRPVAAEFGPTLAVLPFTHGEDKDQEYLADGLTEELISRMSRIRHFPVVAWGTSRTLKDDRRPYAEIGRELGVRYIVGGSVRKQGKRVRVNVELLDVDTEKQLWSNRYDRDLLDIFVIQDDVTLSIAAELHPELHREVIRRVRRAEPDQLEAWEVSYQGSYYLFKDEKEANDMAKTLFERATRLDDDLTHPMIGLAIAHFNDIRFGWSNNPSSSIKKARESAEAAVARDYSDPAAHCILGIILLIMRDLEGALAEQCLAVELDPGSAPAQGGYASVLSAVGRYTEAIEAATRAINLSPRDHNVSDHMRLVAEANFAQHRYEESAAWADRSIRRRITPQAQAILVASYVQLERYDDAAAIVGQIEELGFQRIARRTLRHYKDQRVFRLLIESLNKVGF